MFGIFIYNTKEIMNICYGIKPSGNPIGGEYELIKNGIETNPFTELVSNEDEADWVIYHGRNAWGWSSKYIGKSKIKDPNKAIIIDYHDSINYVLPDDAKYYFKRSIVDKSKNEYKEYNREIHHIPYCVRPDFLDSVRPTVKDIDIGVFFNPLSTHIINCNRTKVVKYVRENLNEFNIFTGLVKTENKEYRNEINNDYLEKMLRCKIIVTSNPNLWEGDYRLYEALISGALVFVDNMKAISGFTDNENICFYDLNNLEGLKNKLIYYLHSDNILTKAMECSIENTHNNHLTKNLIDRILNIIK